MFDFLCFVGIVFYLIITMHCKTQVSKSRAYEMRQNLIEYRK